MGSGPQVPVFLKLHLVPVQSVSPVYLMVVGCFGQWTNSPVYSLWTSGAAVVKPITISHIFLPSQVCSQNMAGVVISHAPENKRSLYALSLGQETFVWWSSWSNRSYFDHRMASPCKTQIPVDRGFFAVNPSAKFVFLGEKTRRKKQKKQRKERKGGEEVPVSDVLITWLEEQWKKAKGDVFVCVLSS